MKLSDILSLTGVSKKSIYRWMESHPSTIPDPNSLIGHPFPRPITKDGRAMIWDEEEVKAWWRDNLKTIGRHPEVRERAVLIAYDASDGIENALYPYRWITISEDAENFRAAKISAEAMLQFLFDDGTRPIAFAIKAGGKILPYV